MKTLFILLFITFLTPGFSQTYFYTIANVSSIPGGIWDSKDGNILMTGWDMGAAPTPNVVFKVKPNGDTIFCRNIREFNLHETSNTNFMVTGSTPLVFMYDKNMDMRWQLNLYGLKLNASDNPPIINDVLMLEPNRFLVSAKGGNYTGSSNVFFATIDTLGTILNVRTTPSEESLRFIAKSGPAVYCFSNDKLFKYNTGSSTLQRLFQSDTTSVYNQLSFSKGLLLPGKKMIMAGSITQQRNTPDSQGLLACFDSTGVCLWKQAISPLTTNYVNAVKDLCFTTNANNILVLYKEPQKGFLFNSDSLGAINNITEATGYMPAALLHSSQDYISGWNYTLSIMNANGLNGCYIPGTLSLYSPVLYNGSVNTKTLSTISYTAATQVTLPWPNFVAVKSTLCGTTGIFETNAGSTDLILFPNPASSRLNVSTTGTQAIAAVEIMNSTGQLLLVSGQVENIDISGLAAGYYLVGIRNENGQRSYARFMKN